MKRRYTYSFLKRQLTGVFSKSGVLLIFIPILFLQGNMGCQEKSYQENKEAEYALGELIVRFKPEAFDEEGNLVSESVKALNDKYGLASMEPIFKGRPTGELADIYKLKFPAEINIMELVGEYQKDPSVIYAEPNYIVHTMK